MLDQILTVSFFSTLIAATVRMATPLLLTGLGELYSERSGMINIGLEGLMTMGAICSVIVTSMTGSAFVGILAAMVAGIACNMIFAWATIKRLSHQIIMGMVINILAASIATLLNRSYFGIQQMPTAVEGLQNVAIPLLSKIPIIGEALFNQNILVYVAYLLVPITWYLLFRTKPGLKLRSVGENPKAADSMGISIPKYRLLGCTICGALSGLSGAFLAIGYMSRYVENIVSGRGFIAFAAVIFGRWNPKGVLLATLLFGFADALQMRIQSISPDVNAEIMVIVPYLVTLIALVFFIRKGDGPAANGINYSRSK